MACSDEGDGPRRETNMTQGSSGAELDSISPFFIVRSLERTLAFYRDALGFEITLRTPDDEPFFGIVRRDGVQLLLKEIAVGIEPLPNVQRHPWARWDAFVHTATPDELADELIARGTALSAPLADTDDGLSGFEVQDPDGHVLFFGRPR